CARGGLRSYAMDYW
nr:immunoglobulin heavy chain junction region [Mus musculus]